MKTLVLLVAALLSVLTPSAPSAAAEPPQKVLCSVCAVHDGETEPEDVVATADFEGEEYGFCSVECRDRFLEDPLAYVTPVLPRPLPHFEVESLAGAATASGSFTGKLTLVDFWATWCPPCLTAIPKLDALHGRLSERGFQVVGISIDEGAAGAKKARKFVERHDVAYPMFLDVSEQSPAWAALHVRAVPAMFLVDEGGRIVAQWLGEVPFDEVVRQVEERLGEG